MFIHEKLEVKRHERAGNIFCQKGKKRVKKRPTRRTKIWIKYGETYIVWIVGCWSSIWSAITRDWCSISCSLGAVVLGHVTSAVVAVTFRLQRVLRVIFTIFRSTLLRCFTYFYSCKKKLWNLFFYRFVAMHFRQHHEKARQFAKKKKKFDDVRERDRIFIWLLCSKILLMHAGTKTTTSKSSTRWGFSWFGFTGSSINQDDVITYRL